MQTLRSGDVVRFYEIIRPLKDGEGGMARVYEARLRPTFQIAQRSIPSVVALKIAQPSYEDRLRSEADLMARFNHSRVVRVYGLPDLNRSTKIGRAKLTDGTEISYMAMEFLDGGSLATHLKTTKRLSVREAGVIARDLALALQHIHQYNVINLDIKPDNVLFRGKGQRWAGVYPPAVLCDFGIARDVNYPFLGEHAGTMAYLAPEQLQYGQSDPYRLKFATDIFQWGNLFFLMLTGSLPFGPNGSTLLDASQPAPLVSSLRAVPARVDQIVERALKKVPGDRYQTANELLKELEDLRLPALRAA